MPERASYSELKVLTTTPTKMFIRKKLARTANTMKNRIHIVWLPFTCVRS